MAQELLGRTLDSAEYFGRVPELQLCFSRGLWLSTFSLAKGQPDWSVAFRQGPKVHLCVERGRLALDRRDS